MTEQRLTDERIAKAFDKYAAENVNTVFSGRVYSHQAPFYLMLFRAGWEAAILSADRGEPVAWIGQYEWSVLTEKKHGAMVYPNQTQPEPFSRPLYTTPVAAAPSTPQPAPAKLDPIMGYSRTDVAGAIQAALATPQPAPELLPPISYATLYAFAERHKISYNALCSAVRSALATPQPAPEQVPVETLLEWAVLDGVVRLSKVMDADLQDALRKFASRFGATPQPAPEWADIIEQRLLTWRQRLMNKSGDHLALDDFMSQESIDDLVDFVCAPLATPQPDTVQARKLAYDVQQPHEWGYRDISDGTFITDNTPFDLAALVLVDESSKLHTNRVDEIENLHNQPDTVQVPREPTQDMLYAMAELDGWKRGDREHPMLTRWEDYWNAAIAAAQESKE